MILKPSCKKTKVEDEDRYVIRKIKGKFKAIKFDPTKMKLRKVLLDNNKEHVESTYTKAEVEKLKRKMMI